MSEALIQGGPEVVCSNTGVCSLFLVPCSEFRFQCSCVVIKDRKGRLHILFDCLNAKLCLLVSTHCSVVQVSQLAQTKILDKCLICKTQYQGGDYSQIIFTPFCCNLKCVILLWHILSATCLHANKIAFRLSGNIGKYSKCRHNLLYI